MDSAGTNWILLNFSCLSEMVLCCPSMSRPSTSFVVDQRPSSFSFLTEIGCSSLLPFSDGGGKMSLMACRRALVVCVTVSVEVVWSIAMKSSTKNSKSHVAVVFCRLRRKYAVCGILGVLLVRRVVVKLSRESMMFSRVCGGRVDDRKYSSVRSRAVSLAAMK